MISPTAWRRCPERSSCQIHKSNKYNCRNFYSGFSKLGVSLYVSHTPITATHICPSNPGSKDISDRLSVYYILGGRITFLKSLFLPLVDTNLWKTFRPNGLMVNLFLLVEKATGIKVDFLDQKEKLQSLEEESVGIGKRSCMHTMQELLVSSSLTSKLSMCQRLAANLAPVIRKIHWTASDWSSPTTKYQTFWSSIFLVFQKKT